MTSYIEKEIDASITEDDEALFERVIGAVMEYENCPYEPIVNLVITDNEGIREVNRQMRDIDSPTDVLSFPAVDYERPSDFSYVDDNPASYLDPETDELILGDICLNADRVFSQAKEYGHSVTREYAFLLVHSLLHLLGYDHETKEQEEEMFSRQEKILQAMGILR